MQRSGKIDISAKYRLFQGPVDVEDGAGQFLKKPALTTVQRNAIRNPRAGMAIFNSDTLQEEFYDGTIWKQSAGGGGPTLMVAASNALASTIARADYQCDGVADEVEINLALAAVNAGPGGRVLLSEGTFTLATPIIFPGNNITLFGMGRNSFIDGDGLLTGNDAIQLVGRTNCTIEELAIQTEDGGAKVCHCIFLDNGCNYTRIDGITIVNSDSDAIHIEGTSVTDIKILSCVIEAADDHGIFVDVDAANTSSGILIVSNRITATGDDGIFFGATGAGHIYGRIEGNFISAAGDCGIEVLGMTYSAISGNVLSTNTDDGISLGAGSDYNIVEGNNSYNNTDIGIVVAGDYNHITANTVNNNGTSIADTGTFNRVRDNRGHVAGDEGIATLTVAANDSAQPGNADYQCDGAADEVQINTALNALPAAGGRVILLEGTYTLADAIGIPANNITLEGQGRSTFLDGDALLTTVHAIIISGVTDVTIRNLAIQTEDTGGKVCHCIWINDGANDATIDGVIIVDSDSDGIHIEGTTIIDLTIRNCSVEDADDVGIHMDMDGGETLTRLRIVNNTIHGTGGAGIFHTVNGAGCSYAVIAGNTVVESGAQGIYFQELTYSTIEGNVVHTSTEQGIRIATASTNNTIDGNTSYNNGQGNIQVGGGGCTNNVVSGNNCSTCGNMPSIYITGNSHYCTVTGNTTQSDAGYGILTESSNNTIISGNTVRDSGEGGIAIDAGQACAITGNTVTNAETGGNTYSGIEVLDSGYATITGNTSDSNGAHGIHIYNADYCTVTGNYCRDQETGDGIHLTGTCAYNVIADNECNTNAANGIYIDGGANAIGNHITGNMMVENQNHGIHCTGYKSKIEDNFMRRNGMAAAGTYHGIYLTAAADGCQVNDNTIYGAGDMTEDGIHLDDGCVSTQINGNFIYNLMGDGIQLAANNTHTQINSNWIMGMDDRGIFVNSSTYCNITGNLIQGSVASGILIGTNSTHNTIDSNEVEGGSLNGIEVNGNCTDCTVTGNSAWGHASGTGVLITGASHRCTVTGNTARANQFGLYIESSDRVVLTGNNASDNTEDGLYFDSSDYCTASGNVSTGNDMPAGTQYNGMWVENSNYCVISDNVFEGNGLHGLFIDRSDYCTVTGNSCNNSNTGDGINVTGAGGNTAHGNNLTGNSCHGNAGNGIEIVGGADADKNIVVANQLLNNTGANLADAGNNTETGHNVVA